LGFEPNSGLRRHHCTPGIAPQTRPGDNLQGWRPRTRPACSGPFQLGPAKARRLGAVRHSALREQTAAIASVAGIGLGLGGGAACFAIFARSFGRSCPSRIPIVAVLRPGIDGLVDAVAHFLLASPFLQGSLFSKPRLNLVDIFDGPGWRRTEAAGRNSTTIVMQGGD
jgi:hypothetical protein